MQEAVDHYEFDILREKHIEEAARMSAKSFQDMNKVWQSYNPTNDVVYQFMKEKILLALANQAQLSKEHGKEVHISFVYLRNGVVIGTVIMYELLYFLNMPYQQGKIRLIHKLEMAGKELQKNLDQSAFKKNENVYAYYGAIDTTLARKNISEEFWANIGEHLHKQGFKYMVARYSHIASYKLTMKLGGEHVGTVTVEDQEKKYDMYMNKLQIAKAAAYKVKLQENKNLRAKL